MPTALHWGPYRFFFTNDGENLPHIYIEHEESVAKFWLAPVRLQWSDGFQGFELSRIGKIIDDYASKLSRRGMSTAAVGIGIPAVADVAVTDEMLIFRLSDGRSLSVPIAWYPRLSHASREERAKWRKVGRGFGVRWDALDEDISMEALIAGRRSDESQESFNRWLKSRGQA